MNVIKTRLSDCVIIEPEVFGDERGFFLETFQTKRYEDLAGITLPFVQDNHSRSSKGVLRGLHFQKNKPQGKLVRVVRGKVYDVAVDLRKASPTFGMWDDPQDEYSLLWNDSALSIPWPSKYPRLSDKDAGACKLSDLKL
jgi:dTDP-4-dehydrorhamnose 3,5-epimerase